MPYSKEAGEVMPNFPHEESGVLTEDLDSQEYRIYKHLESDKIGITDAKDKVKYCVSGLDALRVGDDRC